MAPSQQSHHTQSSTHSTTGPQASSLSNPHHNTRNAPMGLPELSSSSVRGMPKLTGEGASGAYKSSKQVQNSQKYKSQFLKRGTKQLGGSGVLGKQEVCAPFRSMRVCVHLYLSGARFVTCSVFSVSSTITLFKGVSTCLFGFSSLNREVFPP